MKALLLRIVILAILLAFCFASPLRNTSNNDLIKDDLTGDTNDEVTTKTEFEETMISFYQNLLGGLVILIVFGLIGFTCLCMIFPIVTMVMSCIVSCVYCCREGRRQKALQMVKGGGRMKKNSNESEAVKSSSNMSSVSVEPTKDAK